MIQPPFLVPFLLRRCWTTTSSSSPPRTRSPSLGLPYNRFLSYFQVLDNDFFLVAAKDAFMEAARQFLFENYCRIHQVRLAAVAVVWFCVLKLPT